MNDVLVQWRPTEDINCGLMCPNDYTCTVIADFVNERGLDAPFMVPVYYTIRDLMLAGF